MNKEFIDIKTAASLLGKTQRHVRRMAEGGKLLGAIRQGKSWLIPKSADARFLGVVDNQSSSNQQLADVPVEKRNQALQRAGIIAQCDKFAAACLKIGWSRSEAVEKFINDNDLSRSTFYRWISNYKQNGIMGLVDCRGGQVSSQRISKEAWEMFKSLWLDKRQPTVKSKWLDICYINKSQNLNWTIPSLPTMQRYVRDMIPVPVAILHREGLAAYEAKCAPYVENDPDSVQPGQIYVGDHHQFNCWVMYKGKWVRPWITAWEDKRSRACVGWDINTGGNQTTIMLAFKRAVETYGPPESVKIDNGRDYDSEMWTGTTKAKRRAIAKGYLDEDNVAGLYAMMDVGVSFSIPYHPQSKPIERMFDTFDQQFCKSMATYCGKDSARKPDDLNEILKKKSVIDSACSLEEFAGLVERYIKVYNASAHSGEGMEGRSPDQVMAARQSRRVLADGVLELLCRVWSGAVKVGKNGVRFKGLMYGQFEPELLVNFGKKVRLSYDPDDITKVWVYDAVTYRLICMAEQNRRIAYGRQVSEEALREATAKKSRALKVVKSFKDASLTRNTDVMDLALKAMEDGVEKRDVIDSQTAAHLRPVRSVMNGQVTEHNKQYLRRSVKKAAGGEDIETVIDFDIESLAPPKRNTLKMNIFDDSF